MKHVIVIETPDGPKPSRLPDKFQADLISVVDQVCREHGREAFVQTRFYQDSAVAAVHQLYNVPEPEQSPLSSPNSQEANDINKLRALCLRWNKAAANAGFAGSEYIDDPEFVFDRARSREDALHNALRRAALRNVAQGV